MGNNPISNVDPHGDLFWVLPNISFDGGFRIGLTVGAGPFSASASYGSGGLQGSVGIGVGPISANYGSGGVSVGAGGGVNVNGFSLSFGSIGYGSGGFGANGPSFGYGHKFGGENQTSSAGVGGSMNNKFYGIFYALRILQQSTLPPVEITANRFMFSFERSDFVPPQPPGTYASGAMQPTGAPWEMFLGGGSSSWDDFGVLGFSAFKNFGDDVAKGSRTALRQVGNVFESVDDVLANPSLLKGLSYAQVRGVLNGSKGWINSVMTKTRGTDKGWVFRQVNSKGQPTGRMIQYHPGSRRHFGGKPYWKVSDCTNTFRFPAN